jgi:hypothetical protein
MKLAMEEVYPHKAFRSCHVKCVHLKVVSRGANSFAIILFSDVTAIGDMNI